MVYVSILAGAVFLGVILPAGKPPPLVFGQQSPNNPMQEMMRRMMRGRVPPPGMTLERLPDQKSPGARLVARYCAQCHDLPSPQYRTAGQWPAVFDRMLSRMKMMGGQGMMGRGMMGQGGISAPKAEESRTLLAYLRRYGMREASFDELAKGDPSDRAVFVAACSGCHVSPSPTLHLPQEWPAVVARMRGNMRLMNRPEINDQQQEVIVRFLQQVATNIASK